MEGVDSNRGAVRYSTEGLKVNIVGNKSSTTTDNLTVLDLSLRGCAIAGGNLCDIKISNKMKLTFHYTNNTTESLIDAQVAYEPCKKNGNRVGVIFDSALRPEALGGFKAYFKTPLPDHRTQQSVHENQKVVAQNDLEAIRRDVLHLKGCQFQLVLAALPLFAAQGATTIPMFAQEAGNYIPVWAILIPLVCAFLSYTMLIVFLQKTRSIRRNLSFVMLLQRHFTMGSFPICYRGWQDAYENYNHILKYGEKKKYEDGETIKEKKPFNILPTDAFTWLGVGALGAVPIISVLMLWGMLLIMKAEPALYTGVVWASTVIGMLLYFYVFFQVKALLKGDQTFRNMTLIFSKILKYSPPFDPKNFGKI